MCPLMALIAMLSLRYSAPALTGDTLANLTIRNLDEDTKARLRIRAAVQGHSMEEEARAILRRAVGGVNGQQLWALSRELFAGDQGVSLQLPERGPDRSGPDFGPEDEGVR